MIIIDEVTKVHHTRAGTHVVLDRASLTIQRGQNLGILGRNGAGKSTLTRIISGVEHPTSGRVVRRMSVSWPLGFGTGFQGSLTGADNVRFIARIYNVPINRSLGIVSEFAELGDYFYMPIKTYSSGMRARLAFGISLAVEFECLLIDEITAVGDFVFTSRCLAALEDRRTRSSIVMISHDPNTLRSFCECGAILQGGKLNYFPSIEDAITTYYAA